MPALNVNGVDIAYRLRGSGPLPVLAAGASYPGATWPPAFLAAATASLPGPR